MIRLLRAIKPNPFVLFLLVMLLVFQVVFFSFDTSVITMPISKAPDVEDSERDTLQDKPTNPELESDSTEKLSKAFGIGSPVVIRYKGQTRHIEISWIILILNIGACYLLSLLILRSVVLSIKLFQTKQQQTRTGPTQNWHKGPGWWMLSISGLITLWLLWLGLYPSFYYLGRILIVPFVWWIMIMVLLSLAGAQRFILKRDQVPVQKRTGAFLRYIYLIGILAAATILLIFTVPMKIGFLTAEPTLSRLINKSNLASFPEMTEDVRAGIYVVSAEATNSRRRNRGDSNKRVIFILADDHEAAFIFSPSGIDNLSYNSGSKGHLFGKWYWMKED